MTEGEEGEREKKSSRRSERRVEWMAEGRGMGKISPARPVEVGVFWKEMVGAGWGLGGHGGGWKGGWGWEGGGNVCGKGSVRKGVGEEEGKNVGLGCRRELFYIWRVLAV